MTHIRTLAGKSIASMIYTNRTWQALDKDGRVIFVVAYGPSHDLIYDKRGNFFDTAPPKAS